MAPKVKASRTAPAAAPPPPPTPAHAPAPPMISETKFMFKVVGENPNLKKTNKDTLYELLRDLIQMRFYRFAVKKHSTNLNTLSLVSISENMSAVCEDLRGLFRWKNPEKYLDEILFMAGVKVRPPALAPPTPSQPSHAFQCEYFSMNATGEIVIDASKLKAATGATKITVVY